MGNLVNYLADEEDDGVESKVGSFVLQFAYVSRKPGHWIGEVKATPIKIHILNSGTQLDKMLQLTGS